MEDDDDDDFVFPFVLLFFVFERVVRSSWEAFLVGRISPKHPGLFVSSLARLLFQRESNGSLLVLNTSKLVGDGVSDLLIAFHRMDALPTLLVEHDTFEGEDLDDGT